MASDWFELGRDWGQLESENGPEWLISAKKLSSKDNNWANEENPLQWIYSDSSIQKRIYYLELNFLQPNK